MVLVARACHFFVTASTLVTCVCKIPYSPFTYTHSVLINDDLAFFPELFVKKEPSIFANEFSCVLMNFPAVYSNSLNNRAITPLPLATRRPRRAARAPRRHEATHDREPRTEAPGRPPLRPRLSKRRRRRLRPPACKAMAGKSPSSSARRSVRSAIA